MIEKRWPAEAGHRAFSCGAADGARTRDTRNHNPVLYQLSYGRQKDESAPLCVGCEVLSSRGDSAAGARDDDALKA